MTRWESYPLITFIPNDGTLANYRWGENSTAGVIEAGLTSHWTPENSRQKLIKALAEMRANNLITYDELKAALESPTDVFQA